MVVDSNSTTNFAKLSRTMKGYNIEENIYTGKEGKKGS